MRVATDLAIMISKRVGVMAWIGLVALIGCAGAKEETASQEGALTPTSCKGGNIAECGFGKRCENRQCVPSECHEGSKKLAIPAKACSTPGTSCEFEDGSAVNNGVGFCAPKACTGASIAECGFGAMCSDKQVCVPADCHDGSRELGIAPKACSTPGTSCEFEDGASVSHGQGFCTPKACNGGDITECGFGAKCGDSKTCVPSECHEGSKTLGIAAKPCARGASCEFEDGSSQLNGVGFCTNR
jgi:hypothetical protein